MSCVFQQVCLDPNDVTVSALLSEAVWRSKGQGGIAPWDVASPRLAPLDSGLG